MFWLFYDNVDTLGTLARTVGEETFRPLAQDCVASGRVRDHHSHIGLVRDHHTCR